MYLAPVDWLQRKLNKYCYIFCLFPIIVLMFFDQKYGIFDVFFKDDSKVSALLGMCGTFVGFLLMALTIFISLPKDSEYAKRFRKYGHDKIFAVSKSFRF